MLFGRIYFCINFLLYIDFAYFVYYSHRSGGITSEHKLTDILLYLYYLAYENKTLLLIAQACLLNFIEAEHNSSANVFAQVFFFFFFILIDHRLPLYHFSPRFWHSS